MSCLGNDQRADAYGNFEAVDILVAAENSGQILSLDVEEGSILEKDVLVGVIDTMHLHLQKQQLWAKYKVVRSKTENIVAQTEVLEEQKRNLLTEKKRVKNLLKDGAATQKQMDDIEGNLKVIQSRIKSVRTQNASVFNELDALKQQIAQVDLQIDNCLIKNPIKGSVLKKYVEPKEITAMGKAIYKIADISEIILRAYVDGSQLSDIQLGQQVNVFIDKNNDELKRYEGIITWISSEAEFTPKIIQTREERVDLVYAVKIRVQNDGAIKIGMPGEVRFKNKKE
jgi:HlyD family secretion protein